jgi:hypothetical protein
MKGESGNVHSLPSGTDLSMKREIARTNGGPLR